MSFFDNHLYRQTLPPKRSRWGRLKRQLTPGNVFAGLASVLLVSIVWLGIFVVSMPFIIWSAFVIKVLWTWFVVPLHVRAIGLWEAAGLTLIVRMFTYDWSLANFLERDAETLDKSAKRKRLFNAFIVGALLPALLLGFGALYHAFA